MKLFVLLDTEPPTCGFCPTDILIDNATVSEVRVNWDRPECTDNSGDPPSVSSNRQSGDLFSVPGSYAIVYEVTDGDNINTNCSFQIVLESEYSTCWVYKFVKRYIFFLSETLCQTFRNDT